MDTRKISELTVSEFQDLIKKTVQKSVAEVMIEFVMVADIEAQIEHDAEMNDWVRSELQSYTGFSTYEMNRSTKVDD